MVWGEKNSSSRFPATHLLLRAITSIASVTKMTLLIAKFVGHFRHRPPTKKAGPISKKKVLTSIFLPTHRTLCTQDKSQANKT